MAFGDTPTFATVPGVYGCGKSGLQAFRHFVSVGVPDLHTLIAAIVEWIIREDETLPPSPDAHDIEHQRTISPTQTRSAHAASFKFQSCPQGSPAARGALLIHATFDVLVPGEAGEEGESPRTTFGVFLSVLSHERNHIGHVGGWQIDGDSVVIRDDEPAGGEQIVLN